MERGNLMENGWKNEKKRCYTKVFDIGDFQGVVTLGVARAKKCIFPIRGA